MFKMIATGLIEKPGVDQLVGSEKKERILFVLKVISDENGNYKSLPCYIGYSTEEDKKEMLRMTRSGMVVSVEGFPGTVAFKKGKELASVLYCNVTTVYSYYPNTDPGERHVEKPTRKPRTTKYNKTLAIKK